MSSQPTFEKSHVKQSALGEIQHTNFLSEHIGSLYLNDDYSDLTLIVEGQRICAHRVILAARSEYFRARLYGGFRESSQRDQVLTNTPVQAFQHLLRYIYTGQLTLFNLKDNMILEILSLTHEYGFKELQTSICDYLQTILSVRNVCVIYDQASMHCLSDLVGACFAFMDKHAVDVLTQNSLLSLSSTAIRDIISRDSFCAPEVDIFRAVHQWVRVNKWDDTRLVMDTVRLALMSTQELLDVVRPTQLVQPDVLLDAIALRLKSPDTELKHRGYLIPEENVATAKLNAVVLSGEAKQALLDRDVSNYDMERGFTRHPIDESNSVILVRLGVQCIINHIRLLLWDKDQRNYCYFVEVSMNQNDWIRVVDHTQYFCRSWQELYFSPRVVRYIRVVGTHNTVNKMFHVETLEAYYTNRPFSLDKNGIVIPKYNVATINMSAIVIEGVCRSRVALLNGDTDNYDWDSGYTCHQLGSGAIVVQLAQPYAISSMRLLLWDCDNRSYSYYIAVSTNKEDWEIVHDMSKVPCRSWQAISFPQRPVVFIKIVGTHNTANEVFHCVHLECPDMKLLESCKEENVLTNSRDNAISKSNSERESDEEDEDDMLKETEDDRYAGDNECQTGMSPRQTIDKERFSQ